MIVCDVGGAPVKFGLRRFQPAHHCDNPGFGLRHHVGVPGNFVADGKPAAVDDDGVAILQLQGHQNLVAWGSVQGAVAHHPLISTHVAALERDLRPFLGGVKVVKIR